MIYNKMPRIIEIKLEFERNIFTKCYIFNDGCSMSKIDAQVIRVWGRACLRGFNSKLLLLLRLHIEKHIMKVEMKIILCIKPIDIYTHILTRITLMTDLVK